MPAGWELRVQGTGEQGSSWGTRIFRLTSMDTSKAIGEQQFDLKYLRADVRQEFDLSPFRRHNDASVKEFLQRTLVFAALAQR
ncbi:MAG: hypothetical protein H2035_05130 [Acidimicrobiales bacterium]|nr:hypothetical protein [Acidimicrobiales bacterium]HCJ85119.1 hypothetical protein [Acidimicrobiaceae bacterium]